jgi:hypothetical protein
VIRRVQPLHLLPTDRYLRFGTKALGGTLVSAVFEDGVDHQAQSSRGSDAISAQCAAT